MRNRERIGFILLGCLFIVSITVLALQDPIAQDLNYHKFSDHRSLLFVPNGPNVISNIPFMVVGLLGLRWIALCEKGNDILDNSHAYKGLFLGIALVSFGSGYYHWLPDNQTLVWDRLPMTFAFMSLVSIVIAEFCSVRSGKVLLVSLIVSGVASVVYWHFTELQGVGDLRPYAFVQFFPMLAIPIVLLCFGDEHKASGYWWLICWYTIAKILEYFDEQVYTTLGVVSGHSLKHLAAAMGTYVLLRSYQQRERQV